MHSDLLVKGFQVGFEIEAYWPFSVKRSSYMRNSLHNYLSSKKYPDDVLKWIEISGLFLDPTLPDIVKGLNPIELVTPPLPMHLAKKLLPDIFAWMDSVGAQTSECCGLHINLGYINKNDAVHVDYLKLLRNTSQEKILFLFGRQDNEHCKSTKVLIEEEGAKTLKWVRAHQKKLGYPQTLTTEKLWEDYWMGCSAFLKTPPSNKELTEKLMTGWGSRLLELCVDAEKSHAIGDRSSYHGRYFEFRLIGNRDYHLRVDDCLGCLDLFALAVFKSARKNKLNSQPEISFTASGSKLLVRDVMVRKINN